MNNNSSQSIVRIAMGLLFIMVGFNGTGQIKSGCTGDCENGKGTYIWGDETKYPGDKYDGEWKNGIFHGKGVYSWANGEMYDGHWINGLQNGPGIMKYKNGDIYDGEWLDGRKNGKGSMKYASGNTYTGEWKNGTRNGQGTMVYDNGDKYIGGWENGFENGKGKYLWKKGDMFEGVFLKGQRNGEGIYTYADGEVTKGVWENGKLIQEFKDENTLSKQTADKNKCISGNCDNGYGVYIFDNGEKYDGNWKDGKYDGKGTYYFKNKDSYSGMWKNSLFEGYGTYVYKDGSKKEGYWSKNKYIGPLKTGEPFQITPNKGEITVKAPSQNIQLITSRPNIRATFKWKENMELQVLVIAPDKTQTEIDLMKGNTLMLNQKGTYHLTLESSKGTGFWECWLKD